MTGDLVGHNIWDTSRSSNIDSITKQGQFFNDVFGSKVKIYPVIGNHETHPTNV